MEVVIGAGVQDDGRRGLARYFAILSSDGVTSYSCNVSSIGVKLKEENENNDSSGESPKVEIVSLSCAKDEGLGRTYDLK